MDKIYIAQELEPSKTYILKTTLMFSKKDIQQMERDLEKKTKANIIIIDGRFDFIEKQ